MAQQPGNTDGGQASALFAAPPLPAPARGRQSLYRANPVHRTAALLPSQLLPSGRVPSLSAVRESFRAWSMCPLLAHGLLFEELLLPRSKWESSWPVCLGKNLLALTQDGSSNRELQSLPWCASTIRTPITTARQVAPPFCRWGN